MDTQIKEMYEGRMKKMEIKKMVTERTILKHAVNLRKLHKHITGKSTDDVKDLDWVNESLEFIIDKITSLPGRQNELVGLSTQQSYYHSIFVAIRSRNFDDFEQIELYSKLWTFVQGGFGKDLNKYKKSKDNVNLPDYEKVKEIIKEFDPKTTEEEDLKLILKIYETYPFRLEVAELLYIPTFKEYKAMDKVANYLVKKGKQYFFSFSNYKTGDKYGERVINIDNKELIDLLKVKIKSIQKNPVRDLFPGLTRTYMSSKIIKFFKDNGLDDVSPTVLTKLIIQEAYRNMDPKLKETQERLASERGHSIQTQMEIYLID